MVPNPKSARELEAGDRLLCFGKLESMRDMIPEKTRRRRIPKIQDLPEDAGEQNPSDTVAETIRPEED